MRNTDSLVWGFSGGTSSSELDESRRICEKIWTALNSRVCNVVIVIFVFAEGIVVLSELLIDLDVVQDPEWKTKGINCSENSSNSQIDAVSPKLKKAKEAFSYCSICLLTIFIVEIILRIITGKTRFIVQGIEVFDAIIVLIAFGLDLAFFIAPSKNGAGKESAVFIILFRLWRINKIIKSVINSAKEKLSNIISNYQREKVHSEHKVDLLILKVEDLEHEVAYLKEKLKKTEKEPLFVKRRRAKDGVGIPQQKHSTITIAIEANTSTHPSTGTQTYGTDDYIPLFEIKEKNVVTFAEKAATIIVDEAIVLASHVCFPDIDIRESESSPMKTKLGNKLRRRPDGSIESGYGSGASSINWDRVRANLRTDEKHTVSLSVIRSTLKCPESSPESGYGSGGSAHHPRVSSASPMGTDGESADLSIGSSKQTDTVFLFPDSSLPTMDSEDHGVELEVLDEVSEIERIKQVEFDPNRHEKDVPMTSL